MCFAGRFGRRFGRRFGGDQLGWAFPVNTDASADIFSESTADASKFKGVLS